ncbi:ABC transporter permease [Fulvivirgaceae bacterium BMA12]|uniref:ABC transporter permease n=1 Tax=Agaribacillus aureus TaxID=3051825 RepID=A0ABT8LHY0_9BACT|nr:ABC transporter permease [Fulvivirgaceae bacterium BMA12]
MLKNTIKIAFRQIKHQPVLNLLKIGGLAISISAVILMLIYIDFHWRYDQFHRGGKNIFRVQTNQYKEGVLVKSSAMTYSGVGPLMENNLSGVEKQVRLAKWIGNDIVFQHKDKAVREQDFFFAEPSIFELFSFQLKKGDPKTALSKPNSVILSEKVAKKLFGNADPIGQEITMESRMLMKITGVLAETPMQSHLSIGILTSYSTWHGTEMVGEGVYGDDHFRHLYTYTYLLLHPGADPVDLAGRLTDLVRSRKTDSPIRDTFSLHPLLKIHLYSNLSDELNDNANGRNLWILLSIAITVLILAWINYFNISMASAMDRSKAIGIRKIVGASRKQLIGQLFIENMIDVTLSLSGGLAIAAVLKPIIADVFALTFGEIHFFGEVTTSPFTITLVFIVMGTLSAAFLSATFISSTRPTRLFKKVFPLSGFDLNSRKWLVIIQFAVIIGLLAANVAIFQQVRFLHQKDPGVDLADMLIIKGPLGTSRNQNLDQAHIEFKNKLKHLPSVSKVAMSRNIPGNSLEIIHRAKVDGMEGTLSFHWAVVTPSFFEVYKLPLLAGKIPEAGYKGERRVIINEAAMRLMGYQNPQDILEKNLTFWDEKNIIVGVVRNYHHLSLHHPIVPQVFGVIRNEGLEDGYFSIKMTQPDYSDGVAQISEAYKLSFPLTVFEYFYQEAHYYAQYEADNNFQMFNIVFAGLAFFIACLGLFALSVVVIGNRMKEVGIRKTLGASVAGIVALLSKDFLRLVLLGWAIGAPVSWYIIELWLQYYVYRIEVDWWIFFVAGSAAVSIAFATIGFNTLKAAMTNPIDVLRSE